MSYDWHVACTTNAENNEKEQKASRVWNSDVGGYRILSTVRLPFKVTELRQNTCTSFLPLLLYVACFEHAYLVGIFIEPNVNLNPRAY